MYKIKVVYSNGNENIKTTDNFQEAREIYNETKETHKTTGCKISFIDVIDGEDVQRWSKQCNTYEDPIDEILQRQRDDISKIRDLRQYYFDMVSFLSKEQDNILHMDLEHSKTNEYTDQEKLDSYEKLKEITLLRREYKQQSDEIDSIENELFEAQRTLEKAIYKYKKVSERYSRNREYVEETDGELKHKIHKYDFKDNKEKNKLMRELKQEYSRVMVDESKKQIMCFNNCSTNRRARKAQ